MIAVPEDSPTDPDKSLTDPGPEEIKRRAAVIRRGWSASQLERRRVTVEQKWLPPTVSVTELEAAAAPAQAS